MFYSTGTLIYSDNPYKLIVDVDDEIGNYYRSLIPKYHNVRKPLYASHISVIRNEIPGNISSWKRHSGKDLLFSYENIVYYDEVYYWLNAYSFDLEKIRLELGLTNISDYTMSPDKLHRFHITIGNRKHLI